MMHPHTHWRTRFFTLFIFIIGAGPTHAQEALPSLDELLQMPNAIRSRQDREELIRDTLTQYNTNIPEESIAAISEAVYGYDASTITAIAHYLGTRISDACTPHAMTYLLCQAIQKYDNPVAAYLRKTFLKWSSIRNAPQPVGRDQIIRNTFEQYDTYTSDCLTTLMFFITEGYSDAAVQNILEQLSKRFPQIGDDPSVAFSYLTRLVELYDKDNPIATQAKQIILKEFLQNNESNEEDNTLDDTARDASSLSQCPGETCCSSVMPNIIRLARHREDLIRAILAQSNVEAAEQLIFAIADLTEGYNGPTIEEILYYLCKQAQGSRIEISDAIKPLSQAIAHYDRDNPCIIEAKSHIIHALSEASHYAPYSLEQQIYQTDDILEVASELIERLRIGDFEPSYCRSFLFCSPPGTGKTHMIRTIWNESECEKATITANELLATYQQGGELAIRNLLKQMHDNKMPDTNALILHIIDLGNLHFYYSYASDSIQAALIALWRQLDRDENRDKKIICIGECTSYTKKGKRSHARVQLVHFPPLEKHHLKGIIAQAAEECYLRLNDEQIDTYAQRMSNCSPREIVHYIKDIAARCFHIDSLGYACDCGCADTDLITAATHEVLDHYDHKSVTFPLLTDVFLPDDSKAMLHKITEQLQYKKTSPHQPNMLLFCGPAGTGKTMATEAIFNEAGCNTRSISAALLAESYRIDGSHGIQRLLKKLLTEQTEACTVLYINDLKYLHFDSETTTDCLHQALVALSDLLQSPQYSRYNILCIGECNQYTHTNEIREPFARCVYFERPTQAVLQHIFNIHKAKLDLQMSTAQVNRCLSHMQQWSGGETVQFLQKLAMLCQTDNMSVDQGLDTLLKEKKAYPLLQHTHQPQEITDTAKRFIRQLKAGALDKESPRGLIFYGPPGVGKSQMVHAMANEAGCQKIVRSASSLVNEYQGSGAAAVRKLFEEAAANRRAGKGTIIFLDELESLQTNNKHHQDLQNALRELWTQLDTCERDEQRSHILFIGACNDFNCLDQRIRERCECVEFPLPTQEMIGNILKDKAQHFNFPLSDELLTMFLPRTSGWNGRNAARAMQRARALLRERTHCRVVHNVCKKLLGYPPQHVSPPEQALRQAFAIEQKNINQDYWSTILKKLKKAHIIPLLLTGGATLYALGKQEASHYPLLASSLGWSIESFLFAADAHSAHMIGTRP